MPIFDINNNLQLRTVQKTNFPLEKDLQTLIENNLITVFNCRFIASEFSTGAIHAGRIDTLALSEDNNPVIIEYKRGKPKRDTRDIVQLVAQTICLEETLGCAIEYGYLYYHSVNQKKRIEITSDLRKEVAELACQMHEYYDKKLIPKAEYFKNCQLCSLVDICMPRLSKKTRNVDNYIFQALKSEDSLWKSYLILYI